MDSRLPTLWGQLVGWTVVKTGVALCTEQFVGEADAVNVEEISAWSKNVLAGLIKEYTPEDVYNTDKFALILKLMPDKLLVFF